MEIMYAEIIDEFVIICHCITERAGKKYHYQAVGVGRIEYTAISNDYVDAKTAYETLLFDDAID